MSQSKWNPGDISLVPSATLFCFRRRSVCCLFPRSVPQDSHFNPSNYATLLPSSMFLLLIRHLQDPQLKERGIWLDSHRWSLSSRRHDLPSVGQPNWILSSNSLLFGLSKVVTVQLWFFLGFLQELWNCKVRGVSVWIVQPGHFYCVATRNSGSRWMISHKNGLSSLLMDGAKGRRTEVISCSLWPFLPWKVARELCAVTGAVLYYCQRLFETLFRHPLTELVR